MTNEPGPALSLLLPSLTLWPLSDVHLRPGLAGPSLARPGEARHGAARQGEGHPLCGMALFSS